MLGTRRVSSSSAETPVAGAGPVMLATLGVPFDEAAAVVAVDAAVEAGQPLLVVNVTEIPILPVSMSLGYEYLATDEVEASLRAPADLAASLAVMVELLRVSSPRPTEALLQLVGERAPGLLVLGPDRSRLGRRRYAKTVRKLRDRAPCLLWLA